MTTEKELLDNLKSYDTPAITNVVATYPEESFCLALYNPWTQNWYTDQTIRCMYPELGHLAGYAVTCVFGLPDQNFKRLSFMDVIDALEQSKRPTVLIAKQMFPPEIADKAAVFGGNMTTALKSIGCVGVVSDGPSRDIDEIRPMKFQYMLTGTSAGHGNMEVQAINIPVSVGGMDVSPGEIVHMDENGACKFPADKLEEVVTRLKILARDEKELMEELSGATTASEIKAIFSRRSPKNRDQR